jgi:hypothetical protein
VVVWVNSTPSFTSRVAARPSTAFTGASDDLGGHHPNPGTVQDYVELCGRLGPSQGDHLAGGHSGRLFVGERDQRRPVSLGRPLDAFGAQGDPGELGQKVGGLGEGCRGRDPVGHRPQPRRQRHAGNTESGVFRHHPGMAVRAVVVSPVQADRPQHRVDGLFPLGDELGLMARPAVDALTAMAGISGQQTFEQQAAKLGHRGADRQLECGEALRPGLIAEQARCLGGQPLYLRREVRLELREEPPFSAPALAGGAPSASGEGGLASQIASFTSVTCPTSPRKCS